MKKRFALALLFVLLLQTPLGVLAAEPDSGESSVSEAKDEEDGVPEQEAADGEGSVSPVAACFMEDVLYSFIRTDYDAEKLTAQTELIGGITAKPVPVTESGCKITYIFLIDNSASMKKYAAEVTSFAEALIEQEKQDMDFYIITFGEQVLFNEAVDTKKCLDKAAIKKVVLSAIDNLDYGEDWTDTYTGITSVMDYLDKSYPGDKGDLVNLVLLTDGEPDLEDKTLEESHAKAAADRIAAAPETVLHTVSFKEWNPAHVRPEGTGLDIVVDGESDAATAAAGIADFVDGLYRLDFPIGSRAAERFRFEYYLSGMDDGTGDVLEILPIVIENIPVMTAGENGWRDPSLKSPQGQEDKAKIIPSSPDEEKIKLGEEEIEAEPEAETKTVPKGVIAGVAAGVGAVIAIVVILLVVRLLIKRRGGQKKETASGAVPMRFDVISGRCLNAGKTFYLSGQLLIGSDSKCDLVWAEPEVAPQNSRIFLKDNEVYVEDLGSLNGTSLGGMKIYAPNRLRSGERVSIGTVSFKVHF